MSPQSPEDLALLFADLGRDLVRETDPDGSLAAIARRAVDVIDGAEHAAISRGRPGRFETVGQTSDVPPRVDQIQYDLDSGPCVDAAEQQRTFRTGKLGVDTRWPEFGRRAFEEHGIESMLSARLFLEGDDLIAALNIYSTYSDAFDEGDQTVAVLLASHATLAVRGAQQSRQIANLERALESNRGIGVAIGVLMSRHKITQDQSFDLLRIASQHTHRKLVDIATEVAETGTLELPALPRRRD